MWCCLIADVGGGVRDGVSVVVLRDCRSLRVSLEGGGCRCGADRGCWTEVSGRVEKGCEIGQTAEHDTFPCYLGRPILPFVLVRPFYGSGFNLDLNNGF